MVITTTGGSPCEAAVAGEEDHRLYAACMNTTTTCTSVQQNVNTSCGCGVTSPVVNLGSKLFSGFDNSAVGGGNDNGISGVPFGPGLAIGTTVTRFAPAGFTTVTNLATDGTQIYGVDSAARRVYGATTAPANLWNRQFATGVSINGGTAIEPLTGGLILNTTDKKLQSLAQANGTPTPLQTFGTGNGSTPLLGSSGYMYMGNSVGSILAVQDQAGYATAWSFSTGAAAITAAPAIDCSGVLYVAVGNVVHALITDSLYGLRQGSPWPKYQRDSRNSGNADVATIWGAQSGATTCTQ
jgi:hypothetical protein